MGFELTWKSLPAFMRKCTLKAVIITKQGDIYEMKEGRSYKVEGNQVLAKSIINQGSGTP